MDFLIQCDSVLDEEANTVIKLLNEKESKWFGHTYKECKLSELSLEQLTDNDKLRVPVGTIEFVSKSLSLLGANSEDNVMYPIEIPEFLRVNELLNREYNICSYSELIDKYNRKDSKDEYFIKCASILKSITAGIMNKEQFNDRVKLIDSFEKQLYVVSDAVRDIVSEYRVFVSNNNVVGIEQYNGSDLLAFPSANKIKRIIALMQYYRDIEKQDLPKAYTVDLMVDSNYTTSIIEIHNFTACGLYGFNDKILLSMYKAGFEYEYNKIKNKVQTNK